MHHDVHPTIQAGVQGWTWGDSPPSTPARALPSTSRGLTARISKSKKTGDDQGNPRTRSRSREKDARQDNQHNHPSPGGDEGGGGQKLGTRGGNLKASSPNGHKDINIYTCGLCCCLFVVTRFVMQFWYEQFVPHTHTHNLHNNDISCHNRCHSYA